MRIVGFLFSIHLSGLVFLLSPFIEGFQPQQLPRIRSNRVTRSETKEVLEASLVEATGDQEDKSILQFLCEVDTVSTALPYESKDEVISFFECPKNRNLFITAGGKRESKAVDLTEEILNEWSRLCRNEGTALPGANDEVFTVRTGGVKFPGLALETSATMGIKRLDVETLGLGYEVALISDDRKVKGLAPVVYLFNRLTGGGSGNGSSSNHSITRILCEFSEDDSTVTFRTTTTLTITIRFPSILMKILPMSKEKAEEQGSESVTEAVMKDIQSSMDAYEEAFRKTFL